jgi:MFS family permease
MAADLQLEISRVADAVAVFFWCYALFQIPAGWLGDRWGGRRALTLYIVVWSVAIAGMGLAGGLASLVATRALLGVGQAGAYATTASFLRRWIPFTARGLANSAVSLGGRAGGVLAPAVTSLLMLAAAHAGIRSGQWRPVFLLYGLLGVVWAVLFWRWFRDSPRLHADCNPAEAALIQSGQVASEPAEVARGPMPLAAMVNSASLLSLSLAMFAVNVGWIFVGTLLPTYLIKAHAWTIVQAGIATSFVAGAGMAGCLAGGVATDYLVKRVG